MSSSFTGSGSGVAVGAAVGAGVAVGATVGAGVAVGSAVGAGVAVGASVGIGASVGKGVAVGASVATGSAVGEGSSSQATKRNAEDTKINSKKIALKPAGDRRNLGPVLPACDLTSRWFLIITYPPFVRAVRSNANVAEVPSARKFTYLV